MLLRPKILTEFTLAAAKTFTMYIDDAGSFDKKVQATIAAGTYFVAWDMQADDFVWEVMDACYDALVASAVVAYSGTDSDGKLLLGIDSNGKVNMAVGNDVDMRIAWTEDDTAEIGDILGFDTTADLDITSGALKTADWQHAYGWYATGDGWLAGMGVEDANASEAIQVNSLGGVIFTQYLDDHYRNQLSLQGVPRSATWSNGVSYATASTYPYERNVPLECWWKEAREGKRFRVYLDGYLHSSTNDVAMRAVRGDVVSAGTTTTLTATGTLDDDPQEHAGMLAVIPGFLPASQATFDAAIPYQRFHISSHTTSVYTLPNALLNVQTDDNATTYYVTDQRYRTYVVDLNQMREFNPAELPNIEQYDITIPLRKYAT